MPTEYIAVAMRHARNELLPDGERVYAEIPELAGVWANGDIGVHLLNRILSQAGISRQKWEGA